MILMAGPGGARHGQAWLVTARLSAQGSSGHVTASRGEAGMACPVEAGLGRSGYREAWQARRGSVVLGSARPGLAGQAPATFTARRSSLRAAVTADRISHQETT